jgi:L-lactate dehydrogenase (cytochrome)
MRPKEALALLGLRPQLLAGDAERLRRCHSIEDLRRLAARRLPKAIFDFVDGAADDEVVLRRNREAFKQAILTPRQLRGNGEPDLRARLLGTESSLPLAIGPCGQNRLLHPAGEPAIARAAARAGIPYAVPSMGSATMEEIAAATSGPVWFQLYLWRDRALGAELIRRAAAAGYGALVVTIDTPVSGSRTRDLANGLTIPPKLNWRGTVDAALHPRWAGRFLAAEMPTFANVARPGESTISTMNYVGSQFDPDASWDSVGSLIGEWDGPVVIKGVLSAADARRAVEIGADAVVVSNHGGRQFGRAPATLEVLPEVVEEIGGEAEVFLDSGITRGTDIAAALALGADACLIGRASLFGLAAGGEAGVSRALELLAEDLRRSMILLGVGCVDDFDRELVSLSSRRQKEAER